MNRYNGNDKVSRILELSNNYEKHRQKLVHTRSVIDQSSFSRNAKNLQLLTAKAHNMSIIKKLKYQEIQNSNDRIVHRLVNIKITPSKSPFLIQSRPLSKSNSQRSKSASSLRSSKTNIIKKREIQIQNIKMADRIKNSKNKQSLSRQEMNKSYQMGKQYGQLRSKYSEKNRNVMKKLVQSGLRLNKRNLQFLPQIIKKKEQQTNPTEKMSYGYSVNIRNKK